MSMNGSASPTAFEYSFELENLDSQVSALQISFNIQNSRKNKNIRNIIDWKKMGKKHIEKSKTNNFEKSKLFQYYICY